MGSDCFSSWSLQTFYLILCDCLQDHWSSGFHNLIANNFAVLTNYYPLSLLDDVSIFLKPMFVILGSESARSGKLEKNGIKRTSYFRRLWYDWADGTTLHGIKFIFVEDAAIRRLVIIKA